MINLGDGPFRSKECRDIILGELRLAGVTNIITEEKEVEVLDPDSEAGALARCGIMIPSVERHYLKETHFRVNGKLRGWDLCRAWTYWIVDTKDENALIGIEDATALHKEHGKKLRVAGHCGCPAPEPPWLFRKDRIDITRLKDEVVITLDGKFHSVMPGMSWFTEAEKLLKENPGEYLGMGLYHIDTQEAFNAFCTYLIARGTAIDQAEKTFCKERAQKGDWSTKFAPKIDGYIQQEQKERDA